MTVENPLPDDVEARLARAMRDTADRNVSGTELPSTLAEFLDRGWTASPDQLDRSPDDDVEQSGQGGVVVLRPQRSSRRNWWAACLAAAAVALVAFSVTVPALFRHSRPDVGSPVAIPTAAPLGKPLLLQFAFAMRPVAGYAFTPDVVSRGAQQYSVSRQLSAGPLGGSITLFGAGSYDPAKAMRGTKVTVGGRQGYFATVSKPLAGDLSGPAVVWEYAQGAWAVVQLEPPNSGDPDTALDPGFVVQTEELRIAAAVRTGVTTDVRLPLRIGFLPASMHLVSASVGARDHTVTLGFDEGRARSDVAPALAPIQMVIGTDKSDSETCNVNALHASQHEMFIVQGRDSCVTKDPEQIPQMVTELNGGQVEIRIDQSVGTFAPAVLKRVAQSVTSPRDVADTRTWFDGTHFWRT